MHSFRTRSFNLGQILVPAALVTLLVAGCTVGVRTPPPAAPVAKAPDYPALAHLGYDGSQEALQRVDAALKAAGKDGASLTPIVTGLLSVATDPAASAAGRQAACQRLGQALAATGVTQDNVQAFAPLLLHRASVNDGCLALEPLAGAPVDAAFAAALSKADPDARLALIQAIGNRRVPIGVPALVPYLSSGEPLSEAAASSLGQIGTAEALAALEQSPGRDAPALAQARLACVTRLGGPDLPRRLRDLLEDDRVGSPVREAAWKALLDAEPSAATQRIIFALTSGDATRRATALHAVGLRSDPALVEALAQALPGLGPEAQAAVLRALGSKGSAAAVDAAVSLCRSSDASVREAALTCLGNLPGTPSTATLLATIACGDDAADAKTAKHSLSTLSGPGVDDTVIAGVADPSAPRRAVFLEALGSRYMAKAAPLVLKARADPDPRARSAALESAGILCTPADQAELIRWCVGASDTTEVSRALKALASVTLRNPDVAGREKPIIDAIDHGSRADRLRLAHVLPRLGDDQALACAARLSLDADASVGSEGVALMVNWTGSAALDALVAAAEKGASPEVRQAALKAAIRTIERRRTVPHAEPSDRVGRLLATDTDTETKRRLLLLLSRGDSKDALAIARGAAHDQALAADAADAESAILANQSWPPRITSNYAPAQLQYMVDGDMNTIWHSSVTPGMSITLDFGRVRPLRRIVMDASQWTGASPEHYEVYVTDDPARLGNAAAKGEGQDGKTTVDLPAGTRGRYLVIKDTGPKDNVEWAIYELQVD